MDETVTASLHAPLAVCADELADLAGYPAWFDAIASAESTTVTDTDPGDAAWFITLRAQVGPFARSKRLRMVRTRHDVGAEAASIRFERHEDDGRDHSPWLLHVSLSSSTPGDGPTDASVRLHYGGRLWAPPLDVILRSQIEKAVPALDRRLVAGA